jgi:hypothetical protein
MVVNMAMMGIRILLRKIAFEYLEILITTFQLLEQGVKFDVSTISIGGK